MCLFEVCNFTLILTNRILFRLRLMDRFTNLNTQPFSFIIRKKICFLILKRSCWWRNQCAHLEINSKMGSNHFKQTSILAKHHESLTRVCWLITCEIKHIKIKILTHRSLNPLPTRKMQKHPEYHQTEYPAHFIQLSHQTLHN